MIEIMEMIETLIPSCGLTYNIRSVNVVENIHDPKNGHEEQIDFAHELLFLS